MRSKQTNARARIENKPMITALHRDTTGVTPVLKVGFKWTRDGSANPPEYELQVSTFDYIPTPADLFLFAGKLRNLALSMNRPLTLRPVSTPSPGSQGRERFNTSCKEAS